VEKRYENIMNAMYQGDNQVDIETTITYRDGRKSVMKLPIYIETIQR